MNKIGVFVECMGGKLLPKKGAVCGEPPLG